MLFHPRLGDVELTAVLHALGDPVRMEIVRNLARRGALNCAESSCTFRLPKSTLSHHYRVLREAGLVHGRKEGTQVVNTLRREEVDARFPGLLDAVLAQAAPRRARAQA
jgi:DNA-binding transcriptional ArsR family regulator